MTTPQIVHCASGGAVVDFSDGPRWFPDWRTAYAEVHARNPISPAGSSDQPDRSAA